MKSEEDLGTRVIALGMCLALVGCGQRQVFVWTPEDVVGLSILGLIIGGFALLYAAIFLLIAWNWAKKKFQRRTSPLPNALD